LRARSAVTVKSKYFPAVVLIPILVWFGLFIFYPVAKSAQASFYEWNTLKPSESHYVGAGNYLELLKDQTFHISLKNTFLYVLLKLGISVPLGLVIALLLYRIRSNRSRNAFLMVIFMPYVCSVAAMSVLFKWLYQPMIGGFTTILRMLHVPDQGFLNSPQQAIYCIVATDIWQGLGYQVIILLAGLMEVPETYIEAATIDGARPRQVVFRIMIPLLGNVMAFIIVTTLIGAFQVFDRVLVMTRGGPGNNSYVLSYFIYRYALYYYRAGYGSAAAIVMFFMIILISIAQLRIIRPRWK
jgi:multiple sugar transport system permease protein